MQLNDQGFEKPIACMSQNIIEYKMKYFIIKKHAFALVKAIKKFQHFILGNRTIVKVLIADVKFMLSQCQLSRKLAH